MIEFARDVLVNVGADKDELRGGTTGPCVACLPRSADSDTFLLCCRDDGGLSESLRECDCAEQVESDCLLLPLLFEEGKEDLLSGMTATRMTSVLGKTALEARLCDLETSDPKLHRF